MSFPKVLGHIKLLTHCPISVKSDEDLKIASDAEPAPGQVNVSCASSPLLLVGHGFGWPLFARTVQEHYLREEALPTSWRAKGKLSPACWSPPVQIPVAKAPVHVCASTPPKIFVPLTLAVRGRLHYLLTQS